MTWLLGLRGKVQGRLRCKSCGRRLRRNEEGGGPESLTVLGGGPAFSSWGVSGSVDHVRFRAGGFRPKARTSSPTLMMLDLLLVANR